MSHAATCSARSVIVSNYSCEIAPCTCRDLEQLRSHKKGLRSRSTQVFCKLFRFRPMDTNTAATRADVSQSALTSPAHSQSHAMLVLCKPTVPAHLQAPQKNVSASAKNEARRSKCKPNQLQAVSSPLLFLFPASGNEPCVV